MMTMKKKEVVKLLKEILKDVSFLDDDADVSFTINGKTDMDNNIKINAISDIDMKFIHDSNFGVSLIGIYV